MFDLKIREDCHPCVNCRHGCMDAKYPKFAIDLMDNLPWEFLGLIIHADVTWMEATEYAREHGHFLVTWYSEEMKPCAFRYLEGMLNVIVFIAFVRCRVADMNELDLWFAKIKDTAVNSGGKVSRLMPSMFKGEPDAILDCALCYWVQAAIAYDSNESEVCAGSMMQSNFYIGMADWPKLASEMNSATGRRRTAHLEELANELRRLLEELVPTLDGKKLSNVQAVIERVSEPLIEFHEKQLDRMKKSKPEAKPKAISEMDAYIRKICSSKHEYYDIVGPAFERVCERRRGRTPGSRNRLHK